MVEVLIESLGRRGDGIASDNGEQVFVPFSLPGEKIELSGSSARRSIKNVIEPSDTRIDPVCAHFTVCGGCQLQHASQESYLQWKSDLVLQSLSKLNLDIDIAPVLTFPDRSRRKAVFSVKQTSKDLLFGFQEQHGNRVIDIEDCPVTVADIMDRITDLRELMKSVPGAKAPLRVSVLATENGLDVAIEEARNLKTKERQTLIRKAVEFRLSRLSINDEILVETQRPELTMGDSKVTPPPASFVQAIAAAENVMADLVLDHLSDCKNVIDLYSGIGTFALRLARHSKVTAVEGSEPAIKALDRAWRETAGKLKRVNCEVRNLERRPYGFQELKHFDGLVFDPPRAGAELQARQIAKSRVGRVVAVSCNPVTLARDLEILLQGGYTLTKVVPIDQFKYTPHVEVIATLQR